jgi:hypothetical protein
MTHAFFLVMGGFVFEDEHSILRPITVEDLYEECNKKQDFATPKLIQTDALRIPLYNSPSSGAQTKVISSTLLGRAVPDKLAVPQADADSADDHNPLINSSNDALTNNRSTISLIDLIARISEADIIDKSAGDGLSKLIAMVQVVWFVMQLIGRTAARITVTELEVVTAGYAMMNFATYIVWWSKPLRVNQQIVLYSHRVQDANTTPWQMAHRNHTSTGVEFIANVWPSTFGFGKLPSRPDVDGIGDKVGLLWAGIWGDGTIEVAIFSMLLASVFGSIHFAAWNFHFLSLLEMWLWWSNSLAITAIPLLILLWVILVRQLKGTRVGDVLRGDVVGTVMFFILPILYVICRIVLLVLPLIQLRSLPPSAFLVVPWSTFIPHI